MQRYFAYGLNIASDWRLPGLDKGTDAYPDVVIKTRSQEPFRAHSGAGEWTHVAENETRFCWPEAAFDICAGREVIITHASNCDESLIGLILVGPVLATILHQRGLLVLHASAVSLAGFTVAFMGPSGRGKSTLATALYRRGFSVITDDIAAISFEDGLPQVIPGPAQMRLTREARKALGLHAAPLPKDPQRQKWIVRDRDNSEVRAPLPLNLLCEIQPGSPATVEVFSAREALMSIAANGYLSTSILAQADSAATYLQKCAQLAMKVDVRRLRRGTTFDELTTVVCSLVRIATTPTPPGRPASASR